MRELANDRSLMCRCAWSRGWCASKTRHTLRFDQYRAICREHNETDSAAQESLAFYLHSLGIALNYRNDPRLRDKHVLNPHWVTGGIYKILNSQKLADQKGTIRVTDVGGILDRAVYPREMHHFLFDLMKKYVARPQDRAGREVGRGDRREPEAGGHHSVPRERGLHRLGVHLGKGDEAGTGAAIAERGAGDRGHPSGSELAEGPVRRVASLAQGRLGRHEVARQGFGVAECVGRNRASGGGDSGETDCVND